MTSGPDGRHAHDTFDILIEEAVASSDTALSRSLDQTGDADSGNRA